jgi:hypothetical protein
VRIPGITAPTESPVASAATISANAVSVRGTGFDRRGPAETGKTILGRDVDCGQTDKMTDYHVRRAVSRVGNDLSEPPSRRGRQS